MDSISGGGTPEPPRRDAIGRRRGSAENGCSVDQRLYRVHAPKSGAVMTGMPAMTVEQIVEGVLINHVNEHLVSIKATIGK